MSDILSKLVTALNTVLFNFGADAVTWAELLGFGTGAVCVWLTVKARIWNFPIGIANNVFFLVLFWTARLYADAGLQIVFLILGVLGWWEWLHAGKGHGRRNRIMGRATPRSVGVLLALAVPATWGLTVLLTHAGDIAPFWDALATALSLAAQWLLNLKKFENWFFWIAADLVYIPLYFVKVLYLTGIVYAVFLGLCLLGVRAWHRESRSADEHSDAAVGKFALTPVATAS